MAASLDDSYRLISIDISNANDPVPTIRLAGGDIAGRTLKISGFPQGYTPRLAYNPNPDGPASGGYIDPTRVYEDEQNKPHAYFQLPRAIFKSTHAVLAFELLDGDSTVISSRRIPVLVEPPVVNADGGEAYDGLSDLHNAATIAKDAASTATDAAARFNAAVRDGNAAIDQAISDFNTKGDAAITADTKRVTDLIDNASIDATAHEVTPSAAPTVTKTGTGTKATFDFGLPRARNVSATAEATDANTAGVTTSTDYAGDVTLNFSLPRARTVTATAEAGSEAAVAQTTDANGDVALAFTLPRGEKGEKGDTGPQGPAGGPKGDKGDKGDPGESLVALYDISFTGDNSVFPNVYACRPTYPPSSTVPFYGICGTASASTATLTGGYVILTDPANLLSSTLSSDLSVSFYKPFFATATVTKRAYNTVDRLLYIYFTFTSPVSASFPSGLFALQGFTQAETSTASEATTLAEELYAAAIPVESIKANLASQGWDVTFDADGKATATAQVDPPSTDGPTADQPNSNGPTADTSTTQPTGPSGSASTVTAPSTAQSDGANMGGLS